MLLCETVLSDRNKKIKELKNINRPLEVSLLILLFCTYFKLIIIVCRVYSNVNLYHPFLSMYFIFFT